MSFYSIHLVNDNLPTAPFALVNAAQGTAFVHNLICGFMDTYPVLGRATPYHLPHSTEIFGMALTYGGDDRWHNNLKIPVWERPGDRNSADNKRERCK